MGRRFSTILSAAMAAAVLSSAFASAARAGDAEDAVLAEMNFARAHPQDYARRLLLQPVSDWERSLGPKAADPAALAEAIDFLMRQSPLPPLQRDDQLGSAALEHVASMPACAATACRRPRRQPRTSPTAPRAPRTWSAS
jgi:hypothetical protein